jgi:nucleotide-binding universal stress UspA family protein
MAIKEVLLPLTSYPIPTEERAIDQAVQLIKGLEANVSAVTFELDIRSPIGLYADPVNIRGIIAAESKKSATNAQNLLRSFQSIAGRWGIRHEQHTVQCTPAELSTHLVTRSRAVDLTIFAMRPEDGDQQSVAEELIFGSGRPVMIFPDDPKGELPRSLTTIAIAWDSGRPCARAIADALPLLERANVVQIFTVSDNKAIDKASTAMLLSYLNVHGVRAIFEELKSGERPIGEVFTDYIQLNHIELLVMGAYGHSRLREFLLGGATKSILSKPPGWVLLSH